MQHHVNVCEIYMEVNMAKNEAYLTNLCLKSGDFSIICTLSYYHFATYEFKNISF